MRLREIMTTQVEIVDKKDNALDALNKMKQSKIRHLVVYDGSKIAGIVSERDLNEKNENLSDAPVSNFYVPNLITATPDTPLQRAANIMRGKTIGCLPVLERKKLVGIVTISDLLELMGRGVAKPPIRGKRWTLRHRQMGRRTHAAPR